jgi:AraC-like DNA-binding protein
VDLIADIVGTMRASGAAGGRLLQGSGAWGLRFPAVNGTGFHVVRHGTGWLVTPGREPVALSSGDIVFSPYGAEHGLSDSPRAVATLPSPGLVEPRSSAAADFEFVCGGYLLNRGRVHPYLLGLPEIVVFSAELAGHAALRSLVDLMADDFHRGHRAGAVVMPALLDLLLVHSLREVRERRAVAGLPAAPDEAIAAVLRAVHAGLEVPWTVERLSGVAGMPRTAFVHRFGEILGEPPMTYVINQRLGHAARLLRSTSEPLAVVARQVGYASEFAFATAFRRRFGIAPGRYRRETVSG